MLPEFLIILIQLFAILIRPIPSQKLENGKIPDSVLIPSKDFLENITRFNIPNPGIHNIPSTNISLESQSNGDNNIDLNDNITRVDNSKETLLASEGSNLNSSIVIEEFDTTNYINWLHLKNNSQLDIRNIRFTQNNERRKFNLDATNVMRYREIGYQDYDGWYNNLASPSYGARGSNLLRHSAAHYPEDNGIYQIPFSIISPNPYEISRQIFQGPSGLPSTNNITVFFVAFTSHLMNEIVNARQPNCPREMVKIKVPKNHSLNQPRLPSIDGRNKQESDDYYTIYRRCAFNPTTGQASNSPRILINKVTSFIDGSSIYGENRAWSHFLRSHHHGQLKYTDPVQTYKEDSQISYNSIKVPVQDQYPAFNWQGLPMKNAPPPSYNKPLSYKRLLIFGDDRANESPFTLTMGILWFRWHNYLADVIWQKNPTWNDELIFNEARKWVIATFQKITLEDWLPTILGTEPNTIPSYTGYKPELNPAISVEFESLVSNYHSTMIPNGLYLGCNQNESSKTDVIRLCNSYWTPQTFLRHSLGEYLLGMSTQIAEREDTIIVEDLRNFYYGTRENTRKDFVADNIVHSLDAGIPLYNTIRAAFNLPMIQTFEEFGKNYTQKLQGIYQNVNNVDAWTGGMLEIKDGKPGPLFTAIIMNEFSRLRDSDRFWYEGYQKNGLFTTEEYNIIRNITIRDIVLSVTSIPNKLLPKNLFKSIKGDNCRQWKQMEESDFHELCTPLKRFDYFEGSSVSYIMSFLFLGLFIVGVIMTMLTWANKKERASLKTMECQPNYSSKVKESNIIAQEWAGGHKSGVIIYFNQQNLTLNIRSEMKEPYSRVINFKKIACVELYRCVDRKKNGWLLLKVPNEYDHILIFDEYSALSKFMEEMHTLCMTANVQCNEHNAKYKEILAKGFTKKDRQKQLELFFKTAFTKAFADNFEWKNFNNNNSNTMLSANQSTTDRFGMFNVDNGSSLVHNNSPFQINNNSSIGEDRGYSKYLLYRQHGGNSIPNSEISNISIATNPGECTKFMQPSSKALRQKDISKVLHDKFCGSLEKVGPFFRRKSEAQITASDRPEVRDYCLRKVSNAEARSLPDITYDHDISTRKMARIKSCELTRAEFAEALSLKENSTFVENMFALVDKDKNGRISFREFLDFTIIFFKGNAEDKARVIFDMYDLEKDGHLTKENFMDMLESLMELSSIKINSPELIQGLDTLFNSAALNEKHLISFQDFLMLLGDHKNEFEDLHINWEGNFFTIFYINRAQRLGYQNKKEKSVDKTQFNVRTRRTIIKGYRNQYNSQSQIISPNSNQVMRMAEDSKGLYSPVNMGKNGKVQASGKKFNIRTYKLKEPKGKLAQSTFLFVRYLENCRWHVFWLLLYTLIVIGIFLDKAFSYSFEMEHTGLRRIIGYGGSLSRGAASALMFCYSTILLTMCRNMITFFRETFLRHFIPFDAALPMHKYIATLGVIFTFLHIFGHALNFYHLSTQSPDDQLCIMRSFYHFSHESPKFHHMLYGTITGITGLSLVIVMTIIYVFAFPYARRYLFNLFWKTHNLYILFYVLTFLHGLGMMLQMSIFAYFFIGPMILFTIDKLISLSRKKSEIPIIKADLLPSNVTNLVFKKPPNFEYKSGQWVRIALTSQGTNEYHPFTLTSGPHEEHLSLHIRAVGPWTNNLRRTFDSNFLRLIPPPKILLDGPFGEGHQDWDRFQVSVLIGGGIGVTPFASILKDIVHKSTLGTKMKCQKVYFLWITRTQKQFEWLTDIIRDVEEKDHKEFVSVNIFITQLYQKFDLRTAMLYICERHFYKVNDRSLFTGLKAITHFGRPDFVSFFMSLQEEHPDIYKFGVFSCGPPAMTHNVESATQVMNKLDQGAFIHHFENF